MSSNFWLLWVESHYFSQAENEKTACKAKQISGVINAKYWWMAVFLASNIFFILCGLLCQWNWCKFKGRWKLCNRVFFYKNENPTCILINPGDPAYGEATWDLKYVNASSDLILCFTRLPRNVGQMRITKQVFTFFIFFPTNSCDVLILDWMFILVTFKEWKSMSKDFKIPNRQPR